MKSEIEKQIEELLKMQTCIKHMATESKANNQIEQETSKKTHVLTESQLEIEVAHSTIQPAFEGARTIKKYSDHHGEVDLVSLVRLLMVEIQGTPKEDTRKIEGLLTTQALSLNAIFNNLAQRANNFTNLDRTESILRLALKAQDQSRHTLETLARIKNPSPLAFVKQQNIALQQQVNNGQPINDELNMPKEKVSSNELLENNHGERLEPRTQKTAGGIDSYVEPVKQVHRPKDHSRKNQSEPECT